MSAVPQVTKTGPRTYVPAIGETITGGLIVEARASGRIGAAAAGTLKWLGVALTDAVAPEARTLEPVGGVLNAAGLPTNVAVAYAGDEVRVTYSAAAAFGDRLVVGAVAGQAAPAGATPTASSIVGICTEPLGVAAGARGLMRTV